MKRGKVPSYMTVGQLKKQLQDWPDESHIDIWVHRRYSLAVSAVIKAVEPIAVGSEKASPPLCMITGEIYQIDFEEYDWE